MKRLLYGLLLGLLLASLWAGVVSAQGDGPRTVTDDEVNAIARQLYCPVCENTPLDVCATEACRQWREVIRDKLEQGWTEEEIKQYFIDYYGARVVAEPPREGFNWLAYVVPPALILLGVGILARAIIMWRKAAAEDSPASQNAPPPLDEEDEYIRRLEEELKKRR